MSSGISDWSAGSKIPLRVLYCGDGGLSGAAGYLGGVMQVSGIPFRHIDSDRQLTVDALTDATLLILSDYPSANIPIAVFELIHQRFQAGMGVLMLGGWESYTGTGGKYASTPIADLLPIVMQRSDDRLNTSDPLIVLRDAAHPIVDSIPELPRPAIAGMNRVAAKLGARTILSAVRYSVAASAQSNLEFRERERLPLLVVDPHSDEEILVEVDGGAGRGRSAAYLSDAAPHWVGGYVDWGEQRVTANGDGNEVEFGNFYLEFFRNLVLWAAGWNRK